MTRLQENEVKQGSRIALVGLGGRTGTSVVKKLHSWGAKIKAFDRRGQDEMESTLSQIKDCHYEFQKGDPTEEDLSETDLVVLSPGVSIREPFLRIAEKRRIPVWSEVELASRKLTVPILAVTGTNGKSTTTTLLAHILRHWGKNVFLGGNLGDPMINAVGQDVEFVVAEISSFQLEAVDSFHPKIGILLNLTPNHLDRHGDFQSYTQAKANLFAQMTKDDWAIFPFESEAVKEVANGVEAKRLYFSLNAASSADIRLTTEGVRLPDGSSVSLRDWKMPGDFNLENLMAASGAAFSMGCPARVIAQSLASFRGLANRMEEVGDVEGVRFVNDSKSTNPEATIAAISSVDRPLHLIMGGRSKNFTYEGIADALGQKSGETVKAVILYGEARIEMSKALKRFSPVLVESLDEAFELAKKNAKKGDVVLLSPANASFDQFKNYEARGEHFRHLVGIREEARGVQ